MPLRILDTPTATGGFRPLTTTSVDSVSSDTSVNVTTPPQESFTDSLHSGTENIVKDITGQTQNQSTSFIPSVIQNTVGSKGLAGVAQLPGRVSAALDEYGFGPQQGKNQAEQLSTQADALAKHAYDVLISAKNETDPVKQASLRANAQMLLKNSANLESSAKDIRDYTDTTGLQAAGTTINAGLTAATGAKPNILGEVSPAFKTLAPGTSFVNPLARTIYYGGRTIENAVLGAGFNTASNLENNTNPLDNIGTAAAIGAIIPGAGALASKVKTAVQEAANPAAEALINSLIKPLAKDFAYGKNPAQGILNEGIIAKDLPELSAKVNTSLSDIGTQIGKVGQQVEASGIKLDLTPALDPINNAMESAAKSNNQKLVNSLNNVRIALSHTLSLGADESGNPIINKGNPKNLVQAGYEQAVQFLADIRDHTRFTGNPSDDAALNKATKQAYGITREVMNQGASKVDPELGTAIRDLNSRYADLSSARNAIAHRDIVLKRQNIINLGGKVGLAVSVAGAVGTALLTGDFTKAGIVLASELGVIGADKILSSTATKTHIAQFLTRLAPEERQGILNSTPVLKSWYERLSGNEKAKGGVVSNLESKPVNVKADSTGGENKIPIKSMKKIQSPINNLGPSPLTPSTGVSVPVR